MINLLRYCATFEDSECAMKDKCPYYRADDPGYYFCVRRMMLAAAATIDGYKAVYDSLIGMQDMIGQYKSGCIINI